MSNKVTKRLTKKDILTVPNALSLLRLLLIPVIVWMYCAKNWHIAAAGVILFSTATDIVDGWVARTYHMVSDLGKFLDPVADKLTQMSMIVCLGYEALFVRENPGFLHILIALLALFAGKEIIMVVVGSVVLKKTDTINSAKWYGKATTVVLYCAMLALFVFPRMPEWVGPVLLAICAAAILFTLVRYLMFYASLLRAEKQKQNGEDRQKD